ncbi:nucleotide-binding alpha-beta plait domain-containing protein, partial [Tanacetum coccineum]
MANCCGILEEPVCLRVDREVKFQTEDLRELRGTRETIKFELQAYGTAVLRGRMDPSNMMRAMNKWTEAMELVEWHECQKYKMFAYWITTTTCLTSCKKNSTVSNPVFYRVMEKVRCRQLYLYLKVEMLLPKDLRPCGGWGRRMAGAINDLNVLHRSNLFDEFLDNLGPDCPFTVNGHTYNRGYYLAGGIYPTWLLSFKVTTMEYGWQFSTRQDERHKSDTNLNRGVLNGDTKTKLVGKISEPSIVLGDECVMSMNVDNALFGRVKVFASLANLKMALGNEGFSDIVIKYMGEQWVMLEFKSLESMEKFKKCVSVMSWFSQVIKATNEFEVDGRIAWVEVEGVPFKLWTNNTFTRIAEKWGKLLDVDDQDETCFHSKRLCVYLKAGNSIREDFKITHRGKMYWIRANETQGWVPEFTDEYESEDDNSMDEEGEVKKNGIKDEHSDGEIVPESLFEDGELENNHVDGIFSKKEKEVSEDPFNLYSLLKRQNKLDDKDTNSEDSLKHPPGFTPLTHNCENDTSEKKV